MKQIFVKKEISLMSFLVCVMLLCVASYKVDTNGLTRRFNYSVEDKCPKNEPCVRFCCKNDTTCSDYNFFDLSMVPQAENLSSFYTVVKKKPCELMFEIEDDWTFLADGSILEIFRKSPDDIEETIFPPNKYCFTKNKDHPLLLCFDTPNPIIEFIRKLYPILMLLSLPFLVATLFVYSCFKELRNLHGKCLMCYVLGLTMFCGCFGSIHMCHQLIEIPWLCNGTGYIAYLSVLVCFSWLNVMCYDIWFTFSNCYAPNGGEKKRFLKYCLYAFGGPLFITILVVFTDISALVPEKYKTGLGQYGCFINGSAIVEMIYIYIPISCVLLANTTFYCITAYKIYQVQKETRAFRRSDSGRHSKFELDKARFSLYLRLFVMMGVTWIFEILSWVFLGENALVSEILHASDILNCVQGISIFAMFVWTKKVKKLIARKFLSNWMEDAIPNQTEDTLDDSRQRPISFRQIKGS